MTYVSTNLSQTFLIDSGTIASQFIFLLRNDWYINFECGTMGETSPNGS